MTIENKKVAIVHDWITNQGGAENVVAAISDMFPDAPIYTSVYVPGKVPALDHREIRTSWLQKLPKFLRQSHQKLLPLLPSAFEALDLSEFDIIISSSSSFAKSVKKSRSNQLHFCYCHTPIRYLYHAREEYLETYPLPTLLKPAKFLLPKLLKFLQKKDQQAIQSVDYFIANSDFVAARIARYYQRQAHTIHPSVDTTQFKSVDRIGDYYLGLGRFVPYKKFDLLVQTFIKNGLPLKLVGSGVDFDKCQRMAQMHDADNIEFTGQVSMEERIAAYRDARAFIFPAEEDFGLTPIEAMASGLPVLAYGVGGATESVKPTCGLFFSEQTVDSLQQAIDYFENNLSTFDIATIKNQASSFDHRIFQQKLGAFIEEKVLVDRQQKE